MAQRGPDGRGAAYLRDGAFQVCSDGPISREAEVLLIHTRLAIIDLSAAGAQPMLACGNKAAITYNGEIYNYEALRAQLRLDSNSLRGRSDTEVLLHWLRDKQCEELGELVGMFAFAFVDVEAGKVTLARDAFGIKPLFFTVRSGALAFASDLRVLLRLPGLNRSVDTQSGLEAMRYGCLSEPASRSLFSEVRCVAPGTVQIARLDQPDKLERRRWFRPRSQEGYAGSFQEATRDVRTAFLESVALHLKSDVCVGSALSGGIDSSAIVMAMRYLLGDKVEIHTVSHIASAAAKSEEKWVDLVNMHAKAIVHKVAVTPHDLVQDIDDLILSQGEPFGGTSMYAQYGVFREAKRQGLTVMLDGQGADELLAGYTHYLGDYLLERIKGKSLGKAIRIMRGSHASRTIDWKRQAILVARLLVPSQYCERMGALVGQEGLPAWIRNGTDVSGLYRESEADRKRRAKGLRESLAGSVECGLVNLLRYEDRNSMRFSVESRVPFLSHRFADLLLSMPSHYIIGPNGESKYVFRAAMKGIVPDQILARRDKIGFENDDRQWLREAAGWAEETITGAGARCALIDEGELRRAWTHFSRGNSGSPARLWSSLIFLRWLRLFDVSI